MKIKEKGLTGKAADLRKQNIAGSGRKGFNAFKEMAEQEKGKKGKGNDEPKGKPDVYLEFLGNRILVHEEDGGSVKPEDVPAVKGASLKFEGAGEDVSFDEIKVRVLCSRMQSQLLTGRTGYAEGALRSRAVCQVHQGRKFRSRRLRQGPDR